MINIFSLLLRILYNEMFKFCMEIYEKNHLKDKSDSELKELANANYQRLADMFKEFMQMNWLDIFFITTTKKAENTKSLLFLYSSVNYPSFASDSSTWSIRA